MVKKLRKNDHIKRIAKIAHGKNSWLAGMETDTIRAENVDKFMQWIKFTMIIKKWNTIDMMFSCQR